MKAFSGRIALAFAALAPLLVVVGDSVAQDPTGVSSSIEQTASISPEEKLTYAASAVQEIKDAVKIIEKLIEQTQAKKDSDADAVQCLVNRLTSVTALLQVAEGSELALKSALNDGEDERANHEFRKIATARSKTRMLLAEAQRCASDTKLESGRTQVDWETVLQDDDEFLEPEIDDLDLDPQPPSVTPFM